MNNQNHHQEGEREGGGGGQTYWERGSSSEDLEADNLFLKVLAEIPLDQNYPFDNITPNHPLPHFPSQLMSYSPLSSNHGHLQQVNDLQQPSFANCDSSHLQPHDYPHFLPLDDLSEGNEGSMLDTRNKQPFRGPRSAETHNLAERNRRSRLKDKIRTLKETLPNCDKTDADSVLTNAINYVESSKLQLQWMSNALKRSSVPHDGINGEFSPSFRSVMSGEVAPVLPIPPPVCYAASKPTLVNTDGFSPSESVRDGNDTTTALDQSDFWHG